jgi:hypothetical protein
MYIYIYNTHTHTHTHTHLYYTSTYIFSDCVNAAWHALLAADMLYLLQTQPGRLRIS